MILKMRDRRKEKCKATKNLHTRVGVTEARADFFCWVFGKKGNVY
jgi:hypothetical protein